jgi:ribosomal protein S18 acetylase RimI-like enzyme
MTQKPTVNVELAGTKDAEGIHNALMQNLVEIRDVDELSQGQINKLEEEGFLRKEVDLNYYKGLIKDPNIDVYTAKVQSGKIIGFISIHRKKKDINKVRDVIGNLTFENQKSSEFLLDEHMEFAYLDQISIIPEYKRKGIGTTIFQKALLNINSPIVAFIVEKPIFNKASVYWHENNGFEFSAISDGEYKGKDFKFKIFIHWNSR